MSACCRIVYCAGLLVACDAGAGQDVQKVQFEVATVKPTAIDPLTVGREMRAGRVRPGNRISGDRAEYIYRTLGQLIEAAYQVSPYQVVGPDYLHTGRFDVAGKLPQGSGKKDAPAMLRALLADRFQLVVHREFREQAVMALVVGKGGPKLEESPSASAEMPAKDRDPSGKGDRGSSGNTLPSASYTIGTVDYHITLDRADSCMHMGASRMPMDALANILADRGISGGRPVVDMTGLKGKYEVALDFSLGARGSADASGAGDSGIDGPQQRPADLVSDPGAARTLRSLKGLGLALVDRKAQVEQLVVDHAEKTPTEN